MKIDVFENADALSTAAAQLFVDRANQCIKAYGQFTVAFSGGSTPQRMYELLATKPYRLKVDWSKVYAFWGDERFVPADDPQNNARMTREKLLSHVPIPEQNIFPMPSTGDADEAAAEYEQTLRDFFDPEELPVIDLMLMGLGTNGHTASLFPHTKVLHETEQWVAGPWVEEENMHRITLTYPVINAARHIVFMAYGSKKASVVRQIIEGERNIEEYPAQLIQSHEGTISWMLDEGSAADLSER